MEKEETERKRKRRRRSPCTFTSFFFVFFWFFLPLCSSFCGSSLNLLSWDSVFCCFFSNVIYVLLALKSFTRGGKKWFDLSWLRKEREKKRVVLMRGKLFEKEEMLWREVDNNIKVMIVIVINVCQEDFFFLLMVTVMVVDEKHLFFFFWKSCEKGERKVGEEWWWWLTIVLFFFFVFSFFFGFCFFRFLSFKKKKKKKKGFLFCCFLDFFLRSTWTSTLSLFSLQWQRRTSIYFAKKKTNYTDQCSTLPKLDWCFFTFFSQWLREREEQVKKKKVQKKKREKWLFTFFHFSVQKDALAKGFSVVTCSHGHFSVIQSLWSLFLFFLWDRGFLEGVLFFDNEEINWCEKPAKNKKRNPNNQPKKNCLFCTLTKRKQKKGPNIHQTKRAQQQGNSKKRKKKTERGTTSKDKENKKGAKKKKKISTRTTEEEQGKHQTNNNENNNNKTNKNGGDIRNHDDNIIDYRPLKKRRRKQMLK